MMTAKHTLTFITPDWPAPQHIKALCSTRLNGVSQAPFNSLNLATHVGDESSAVLQNRHLLKTQANLPSEPIWLDQQHTDKMIYLDAGSEDLPLVVADASWTDCPQVVSVVMTADCLPVLVTNLNGSLVSAIHAGWKGLADGIVSQSILALPEKTTQLMAWIGPAIGPDFFEVGEEVRQAFVQACPAKSTFFKAIHHDKSVHKYLADLPGLVRFELAQLGLNHIYGGDLCTYAQQELFFSYRRSGQTGRIASLIWIDKT